MKLIRAQVLNYRSAEDSETFDIGKLTCLVGKNESGKTTLLQALRGVRPIQPHAFSKVNDYPRRFVTKYDERHPDGKAPVARTWWKLDEQDLDAISQSFGDDVFQSDEIEISHGYGYDHPKWVLPLNVNKALGNIAGRHSLSAPERNFLQGGMSTAQATAALQAVENRSQKQEAMLAELKALPGGTITSAVQSILEPLCPKFFYTSHFERMAGEISVEQLIQSKANKTLSLGDQIFLDFLEYAGTSLEELRAIKQREDLKAQCEAAGNDITEEIFQFWSQNQALEVTIDFDTGKPGDKAPFNSGTVVQIRIRNTNHKATLPLSERSAGFVWFFSFLAQFKQLRKTAGNAILLLDEPGLTLHGKAQGDLLRYITDRLLPEHQVIFTTHSPFMIPPARLEDVRIVEDVIEHSNGGRPVVKGTKVRSDVLRVDSDTLFPLQGALGFDITQTLFVGRDTLLVEGTSDIVYLTVFSEALRRRGRQGLDRRWTVTPSGGIDKIAPFVRLFGGNGLNVAVLSDRAKGDQGKLEKLRSVDVLKAGQFYTIADLLGKSEADVEDIFEPGLFCDLLNHTYSLSPDNAITPARLDTADGGTERLVKKAEAAFKLMPPHVPEFDHFAPADWLLRNPQLLDTESTAVAETLSRAELIIQTYNSMLPKR